MKLRHFLSLAVLLIAALAFFACDYKESSDFSPFLNDSGARDEPWDDPWQDYYQSSSSGFSSSSYSSSSGGSSSSYGSSSSSSYSSSGSSSSGSSGSCGPQPVITPGASVNHGGETYATVVIGGQTWFRRNLNIMHNSGKGDSRCYEDQPSYCSTYGRLYNWAAAMDLPSYCNDGSCAGQINSPHQGLCPAGWRIPSDYDWTVLTDYIECDAGTKLKANSSLWEPNTGTDDYGFAALPGGSGLTSSFSNKGYYTAWWSATEYSSASQALYRSIFSYYGEVSRNNDYKSRSSSVRCVKN